ncbi:MAG: hypothetical protein AAF799_18250 [Myxococcota bacterium]
MADSTPHPSLRSLLARRQFLRTTAAGLVLVGCGRNRPTEQATTSLPEPPEQELIPVDAPYGGAAEVEPASCGVTEDNIEGPFFRPDAPVCEVSGQGHCVLSRADAPGQAVTIRGRVLDRECRPIRGARLEIWHADHEGAYDHRGFAYRGQLDSDDAGRYRLDTIVPGRYLNGDTYRPAHIHVKVRAPGRPVLTTQLYFAGDPYNRADPFIRRSLIMKLTEGAQGVAQAGFDFVV